mmetsp:Transcript_6920/g.12236  ORF Transcript_6920/g.12236 Transcript_6920/m.12236 type:complete len:219 (+) Transcript_6920:398-1054(+)
MRVPVSRFGATPVATSARHVSIAGQDCKPSSPLAAATKCLIPSRRYRSEGCFADEVEDVVAAPAPAREGGLNWCRPALDAGRVPADDGGLVPPADGGRTALGGPAAFRAQWAATEPTASSSAESTQAAPNSGHEWPPTPTAPAVVLGLRGMPARPRSSIFANCFSPSKESFNSAASSHHASQTSPTNSWSRLSTCLPSTAVLAAADASYAASQASIRD